MKQNNTFWNRLPGVLGIALALAFTATTAGARAPCGGFGECKVLVEINASDGDIGFHFLMDGDDLTDAKLKRPDGRTIFKTEALRELREQTMTETFVESAEPLCFDPTTDEDPENDEEPFVTLEDFLARWSAGTYKFVGLTAADRFIGTTDLTFALPAAPANVNFNPNYGTISWDAGNDLGACATQAELDTLVGNEQLPTHPMDVVVKTWEVVFEADVEDGDPRSGLKFTIRVPGDIADRKIRVPRRYLEALGDDTPAKIEIGAISDTDNATFTELADICANEVNGCFAEE
jgi:hypothetical protein